ncbi:MAG TPA: ABC transporter permease, partial [Akkermansia sp.]|nr:ABC transporter permease [Akkermansia sp.]
MHPSIKNILQSSVFILLALTIWEYGSLSGWWRPFLFPAPSAISGYLEEAIRDNSLWAATVVTIRRLLLGYLAGISIGIPAGLLSARFQLMRNTIGVLALG